jgi:hypothetical protein
MANLCSLRNRKRLAFAPMLMLLAGCSMNRPQIGAIAFVNASGTSISAPSSVAVNGPLYMLATVTNDDELLGVSWTVTCGSAPPPNSGNSSIDTSCGTFNPTQTLSGPIPLYPTTNIITTYTAPSAVPKGGTVTITAHATALPSVTSSITLTVVAAQTAVEPASTGKKDAVRAQADDMAKTFPIAAVTRQAPSRGL